MPNDTEIETEITNVTGDPAYEALFQSAGALADELVKDDDANEDDPFVAEAAKGDEPKATDLEEVPEDEPEEVPEQSDEDKLAALDPVNYVVDGQTKDFPGVRIFKDADGQPTGFIGKISDLPTLQARLSKADYYEANFAGAVEKAATARLNTMEFTDGAKQIHRGAQAFDASQLENARLSAAVKVFASTLEDPATLIELAYAVQQAVAAGQPATSVPEMARLQKDLNYALKDAVWNHRETKGRAATAQQQTASAETQRAQITTNEIKTAVETWGKRYPGLTASDTQDAIAYLTKLGSAIVRPPSPEEQRRFGLAAGSFVTDHPVVDGYLANLHKARVAANASAKTTDAVTAENARRRAAVNAGKPSNSKKPAASTRRATVPPADTSPTWEQIKDSWSMGVPLDVSGTANQE